MTKNTTTSNTSTNQICTIFHESVIHNNGEIHMSQFEEPLSLDDSSSNDGNKNIKNKHTINEKNIINHEDHLLLKPKESDNTTTHLDNPNKTNKTKTPDSNDNPTNDNDKKPPAIDISTTTYIPTNKEDIITKAKYRYGRKSSLTTSIFKKFQPPFKTKPHNITPTSNDKPNHIDELIISILNNKRAQNSPIYDKNNNKDNENTNDDSIEKNPDTLKTNIIGLNENPPTERNNHNNNILKNPNTIYTTPNPPIPRQTDLLLSSHTINKITPNNIGDTTPTPRTPIVNHNYNNYLQRSPYKKQKTTDTYFNHNPNTIPQTGLHTPAHQLTSYLQTSNDSRIKIPYLNPELESLKPVIMSQHSALSQHIIELGNTCLRFTTIIENKKDSSIKLIEDGKIPRSLRLKCDLTTSPSYENNPNFILLKKELQDAVSLFTTTGLEIMKKWSVINIHLLINDKCNNIMKKAISILDGLYSYWDHILGPANWPNKIEKNILLLLLKIYFETDYIPDNTDIIDYFELPPNEILLLSAKIITENHDNIYNQSILTSIDELYLEFSGATFEQLGILKETIKAFNHILRATTIELWETNLQNLRQIEASQNLQIKMDTERISSATVATAKSINKAIETINSTNDINETTHLRILNLEKRLIQQNQTSNEILNHLKKQKNLKGSQQGPLTAPINPFTTRTNNIVDLTMAPSQSPEKETQHHYPQQTKRKRNIQWDNTQNKITEYNPISTPTQIFSHSTLLQPSQPNPFQPNPFNRINSTPYLTKQRPRDAKSRGGRRGTPLKYQNK
jgi:hypothetical protein